MKEVLVSIFLFLGISTLKATTLTKEEVSELYKTLYVTSQIENMNWTAGSGCSPGKVDASIFIKATNRVNFFRKVCGLSEVVLDPTYNADAQAGAYWCKVNNTLSHTPEKGTKCFSEAAYTGCNKACLGFSDYTYYVNTAFISGFMYDYGESNYYVGHRRCILSTHLASFSYGATDKTESLLVMKGMNREVPDNPDFIAYPWNGFVPVDLIYPKWSFSIPRSQNADFNNATVTMTDANGKSIQLKQYKIYNYQDPTLVWLTEGLFTAEEITYQRNSLKEKGYLNKKITVSIKNVLVDGKVKNYEYTVTPFTVE